MRWSGFAVLALFGTLYLLLSLGAEGLLQAFGFIAAGLFYVLSVVNFVKPRK
jgi:hypothetical protein